MSIKTKNGYVNINKDSAENFHGNHVVYIHWDKHNLYTCAGAFPLPPDTPFNVLTEEILPDFYFAHPDYKHLDWDKTEWLLDDEVFHPEPDKSLKENGVGHKSLLRFITPELKGIKGSGN